MWELTITHGEYHDLKTLVHRSKNEHDWTQEGAYWHFSANDDDGQVDWTALVANVQLAVDVKQVEEVEPATAQGVADVGVDPLCFDTEHDHSTSSCLGSLTAQVPPIGPWETGR